MFFDRTVFPMELLSDREANSESADADDDCREHEDVNKRIGEFVWVYVYIRCVAFDSSVFAMRRIRCVVIVVSAVHLVVIEDRDGRSFFDSDGNVEEDDRGLEDRHADQLFDHVVLRDHRIESDHHDYDVDPVIDLRGNFFE